MLELHHDISRPLENPKLRVLSLGAGVQSTTLALMAARGEIEPLDCAIFADTQAEPEYVYKHLNWLESQLPFPVYRVSEGSLRDSVTHAARWSDGRYSSVPFFTDNGGMGRRQCIKEYKLTPIQRKIRELIGLKFRERGPKMPTVEQWIGISTDEIVRIKVSGRTYVQNRWPLIEARMNRRACLKWLAERQYPAPPKSACVFCPYHDNASWAAMKVDHPETFAEAVAIDALIRSRGTMKGMNRRQFVHRSLRPLDEIDFDSIADAPPGLFDFANECEGMCGV